MSRYKPNLVTPLHITPVIDQEAAVATLAAFTVQFKGLGNEQQAIAAYQAVKALRSGYTAANAIYIGSKQ